MSAVQLLKDKAKGSNYIYLKLLQKYRFDANEMHYVFEGYDDVSFYFNFIRHISDSYVTHVSLGKKQSVELYQKIDWTKYDKTRIIIFIDKDYSRLLDEDEIDDENIYETTYYSIENYIPSTSILRRLINEILHFHEEETISKILEKYDSEYMKYTEQIKPIISWILLVRSNRLKANLNNIDIAKLFDIDRNLNCRVLDIDRIVYLESVTGVKTPVVGLSIFRRWYQSINQLPCKEYVRGKYEMWFLLTFFRCVNPYLREHFGHTSKVKTDITHGNAIEIIGPRTVIPPRLSDFLKKIERNG